MHTELLQYRRQLKAVKTETRELEMTVDEFVTHGPARIQFSRDIKTYGLYEALLYAKNPALEEALLKDIKRIIK